MAAGKFKPKPVDIEAIQFTGTMRSAHEVGWFYLLKRMTDGVIKFYPPVRTWEIVHGVVVPHDDDSYMDVQSSEDGYSDRIHKNYWVVYDPTKSQSPNHKSNLLCMDDEKFRELYQ